MIEFQENLSYFHLKLEENGIKAEKKRDLFLENIRVGQEK